MLNWSGARNRTQWLCWLSGTPAIPAHNQTKTWISVKDGFPYKIESDAGTTYQGKAVTLKTTTTYSEYNADIKIALPKEQQ
jgi:hypothetical protein